MAIFVRVIEEGAMRRAALSLGMTPAAVSQQIGQLETQLDTRLLHRSTRKLSLTEAGQAYFYYCQQMVQSAQEAEQALAAVRHQLAGEIRMTAPVGLAARQLPLALAPLLAQHSKLNLTLLASDECLDMVEHRLDIAFRAGPLEDSTLVATPVCDFPARLCASPAYLESQGIPETVEALQTHAFLVQSQTHGSGRLQLTHPTLGQRRVRITPRIQTNNLQVVHRFARQGLGMAVLPEHEASEALENGALLPVLPGWQLPGMPFYLVTPNRQRTEKVEAVIATVKRYFSNSTTVREPV
ncbi:LysR family transcriptional regulator [Ferrimonas sp. SCSIO 43195]|nr:LysR family transcriptional regulator [Ferrimonas sp. SCSIO 43195]